MKHFPLTTEYMKLACVKHVKYLGVNISENLGQKTQISLSSKAEKVFFQRLKYASTQIKLTAHLILHEPALQNTGIVWNYKANFRLTSYKRYEGDQQDLFYRGTSFQTSCCSVIFLFVNSQVLFPLNLPSYTY